MRSSLIQRGQVPIMIEVFGAELWMLSEECLCCVTTCESSWLLTRFGLIGATHTHSLLVSYSGECLVWVR